MVRLPLAIAPGSTEVTLRQRITAWHLQSFGGAQVSIEKRELT
jgi:hypothetical protein